MTKISKAAKPNPRKPKAPAASKKASGALPRARVVKVQEAEVALTELQQRFVEEYLFDLNATQAAIRAKYREKTARQMGAKPVIQAAIAAARLEQQERTQIVADRLLREAWNQAAVNLKDRYVQKKGAALPSARGNTNPSYPPIPEHPGTGERGIETIRMSDNLW